MYLFIHDKIFDMLGKIKSRMLLTNILILNIQPFINSINQSKEP